MALSSDRQRRNFQTVEERLLEKINRGERVARNIDEFQRERMSIRDRLSGAVGSLFGNWLFVFIFTLAAVLWVILNSVEIIFRTWEPADLQILHYLILNVLLFLAVGVQMPIILMRQMRQEARDRIRAEYEYELSLKQEWEIEGLHHKIDALDQSHLAVSLERISQQLRQLEAQVQSLKQSPLLGEREPVRVAGDGERSGMAGLATEEEHPLIGATTQGIVAKLLRTRPRGRSTGG